MSGGGTRARGQDGAAGPASETENKKRKRRRRSVTTLRP